MIVRCRKGTTARSQRLMIRGDDGRARTGLNAASPGAAAYYVADGTGPVRIDLLAPADGFQPGAFAEVDAEAMPGLYALDLPDDLFAGEGNAAVLMLRFDGAEPTVVHFDLVAYDPYDSVRLGLSCLSQEARHACLSSAFQTIVPEIVDELIKVEDD